MRLLIGFLIWFVLSIVFWLFVLAASLKAQYAAIGRNYSIWTCAYEILADIFDPEG